MLVFSSCDGEKCRWPLLFPAGTLSLPPLSARLFVFFGLMDFKVLSLNLVPLCIQKGFERPLF